MLIILFVASHICSLPMTGEISDDLYFDQAKRKTPLTFGNKVLIACPYRSYERFKGWEPILDRLSLLMTITTIFGRNPC